MSVWLIFLLGGLATYAMRLSFIFAFGRWSVPPALHRALRFVPAAVLSAIVVPEVLLKAGRLDASCANPRAWAAAVAVIAGVLTRRTLPTIVAGMIALFVLLRI